MRLAALAIAAVFFTGANACAQAQRTSSPIVFSGVSVIPMDREAVLANQTVIVENGRITYVGGPRPAPRGATVIEAQGKFLMPGLAEFHAHVPSGSQAIESDRRDKTTSGGVGRASITGGNNTALRATHPAPRVARCDRYGSSPLGP